MSNLLFFGGTFWITLISFVTDTVFPTRGIMGLGYGILVILGVWSPWRKYYL